MAEEIEGWGTPESAWSAPGTLDSLPVATAAELLGSAARLVVVAPHPDDEVLCAAGMLRVAAAAGLPVLVVAVSDGTASHPGSARWSPEALALARPRETHEALHRLGLIDPGIVRLGQPDGAVRAGAVSEALAGVVAPDDLLVVTWRGDGHPDHEAAGQAVADVAAASGQRVLEAPVWTWHWASPADPRVPWGRAVRLLLSAADLEAKRTAVQAYRSQLEPDPALAVGAVLPPAHLDRLVRAFEVYFGSATPLAVEK